ncbi:MAG: ABC transporter permease [Phycisphaerae bacterium]
MQFWAIVVASFRESLDRKIFWVLIAITAIVILAMVSVGFEGNQVSFIFGIWKTDSGAFNPLADQGPTRLAAIVVYLLFGNLLGWVGVILMLIATAGVFPSMIDGGVIGVLLSKPISRSRLFFYKYLASMVFVAVQGIFFVGGTFLAMGLRWGVWCPGYLLAIPGLVLLFSYVYCVTAVVGVQTRSTVAAVLVSITAWAVFALVHQAPQFFEMVESLKKQTTLYNTVRVVSWIPPKTGDIEYLVARWGGVGPSADMFPQSKLSDQDVADMAKARTIEEQELEKSPLASIGSSLLFEAAVILFGMWRFSRRDF